MARMGTCRVRSQRARLAAQPQAIEIIEASERSKIVIPSRVKQGFRRIGFNVDGCSALSSGASRS